VPPVRAVLLAMLLLHMLGVPALHEAPTPLEVTVTSWNADGELAARL
jgi:hypothetical protein